MKHLKTFSFRGVLVLGGLCALACAADAQSAVARAKVPFEFAAGRSTMPPGEYTLQDLSGVILLRGDSGNSALLFTTSSPAPAEGSSLKLVFERSGGMAYLAAIEWPGGSTHVIPVFQRAAKGVTTAALH